MKLVIIQYNLTEIILHSVTDHNCDLRSTAILLAQWLKQTTRPFIGLSLFILT